jgi:hypothetical protein
MTLRGRTNVGKLGFAEIALTQVYKAAFIVTVSLFEIGENNPRFQGDLGVRAVFDRGP